MSRMGSTFAYINCGECGAEIEIERTPEGLLYANGSSPIEADSNAVVFHPYHGVACEATLIVPVGDLPE